MRCWAPAGNRLYYVAFVDRGEARWVISPRFAGRSEVKHYVENQPRTRDSHADRGRESAVRGRPKSPNKKQLVSVRYSPEVLRYFRGTGEGWQARMDGVLLDYVAKRAGKRAKSAS